MKHVLIFKFPYQSRYGGGERHTLELVQSLREFDFSFSLVSSCTALLTEFARRQWPAKKVWAAPEPVAKWSILLFPLFAIPMWFELVGILVYFRFKYHTRILYCLSLTEKILATLPARALGIKVVWVEHVGFDRWLTLNPLRPFFKLFSRLAHIVVISEALKKQLIKLGVKDERISVIYNGLDFEYYQRIHRDTPSHGPERFIVGTVSRLEKEKGIEYLLVAVQKVLEVIPVIQLVIVGDGSERKQLEWLAKRLNLAQRVQFVGFQAEPALWLRDFDVFALPSVGRESFGIVLVEALALGRPVVASEIEGTPEIVKQMETGLLVQPGNAEELAQALIYYSQNPQAAKRLANQGRAFVTSTFTRQRMIQSFFDLFQRLV